MKKYTISNIIFLLFMIASGPIVFYSQLRNGADSVSGDWAVDLLANERLHKLAYIADYQIMNLLLITLAVIYPIYCGYKNPVKAVWFGLIIAFVSTWIVSAYLHLNWFGECYDFCGSFRIFLVPVGFLITTTIGTLLSKSTYKNDNLNQVK